MSLAEVLAELREGAYEREREHTLLFEQVAAVKQTGFGALRVPAQFGGSDASLAEVFDQLIQIAAADSNVAHVWRGHIAFVEGIRRASPERAERWFARLGAGELVGNAQSEQHQTSRLETRVATEPDGPRLTGTKFYTTGSIYADWIHLVALDDNEQRVALTVPARAAGVEIVDDWDGFGQQLTGSGTTTFAQVAVDPTELNPDIDAIPWHGIGSLLQLGLLGVIAGIAQRALDDTVAFVLPRERTFGFSGVTPPRDDELVQLVIGRLSTAAKISRRLVLSVAADLGAALDGGASDEEFRDIHLDVFRLQQHLIEVVTAATSELFEVGGAQAVTRKHGLDRHWRNVRTIASHNPVLQRTRALGLFELSGTLPDWKAPGT